MLPPVSAVNNCQALPGLLKVLTPGAIKYPTDAGTTIRPCAAADSLAARWLPSSRFLGWVSGEPKWSKLCLWPQARGLVSWF